MVKEQEAPWRPLEEDVERKIKTLEDRGRVAENGGQGIATIVMFASTVVGFYRILKGDKVGTLAFGGVTLAAVAASEGLRKFTENCDREIVRLENTPTIPTPRVIIR